MSPLKFDTYYRYADLTAILENFAAQYPALCRLSALGASYEGRTIWLVTLTHFETGADTDKPAFWVDGNIHASEVSPSSCALATHTLIGSCSDIPSRTISNYQ